MFPCRAGPGSNGRHTSAARCLSLSLCIYMYISPSLIMRGIHGGTSARRITICGAAWRSDRQTCACKCPRLALLLITGGFAEQNVWDSTRNVTVCGAAWRSDRQTCACKCPRTAFFFTGGFAEQDVWTSTRKVTVCGAVWRSGRQSCAYKCQRTVLIFYRWICRA